MPHLKPATRCQDHFHSTNLKHRRDQEIWACAQQTHVGQSCLPRPRREISRGGYATGSKRWVFEHGRSTGLKRYVGRFCIAVRSTLVSSQSQ